MIKVMPVIWLHLNTVIRFKSNKWYNIVMMMLCGKMHMNMYLNRPLSNTCKEDCFRFTLDYFMVPIGELFICCVIVIWVPWWSRFARRRRGNGIIWDFSRFIWLVPAMYHSRLFMSYFVWITVSCLVYVRIINYFDELYIKVGSNIRTLF